MAAAGRRDPFSRNIHVAAAAAPRPVRGKWCRGLYGVDFHAGQHLNPLSAAATRPAALAPDWFARAFRDPRKPLTVDVGCALGGWCVESAAADADRNFLGLEIRPAAVDAARRQLDKAGVDATCAFVRCRVANQLSWCLRPCARRGVYLNIENFWRSPGGVGATRLRGISTSQPRRRRDPSSRNIHVAAAAAPRSVSTEYPRRGGAATRLGISTSQPRRDPSRNIHVAAAAAPRPVTEYPRRSRGGAATRHGISASQPRLVRAQVQCSANVDLERVLGDAAAAGAPLERVCVQFPDPHFKKKHRKRRAGR